MKTFKLKTAAAAMLPIFALSLVAPAYASDKQNTQANQSQNPAGAQTKTGDPAKRAAGREMRLSQLIGKDVRNAQGEDLGDIKDAVLDLNNGRLHYVILSFGGFLGIGDKLFAYPARAFSPASDKDELVLNIAKERLKDAPGFESNKYPDFGTADYRGRVDKYFGPTLTIEPRANMRLIRGSELLGKDVNGADGRDLGEIQDVVINMADGTVRYAVLEFDKSWSMNDKLFAFPLRSFKQGANWSDDLSLNVSKDKLDSVPGFDKSSWPNLNDPKWIADIDRYLVTTTVTPLPSTTNDALWNRLDANKDGSLSADEAKADSKVQSDWGKMDSSKDGTVSRREFDAANRR